MERRYILSEPLEDEAHLGRYVLIADNQEHHLLGGAAYPSTMDWVSPVMIRPPQSDLWGHSLTAWVLRREAEDPHAKMIHLGDMADISCESEATRIFDIIRASKWQDHRWVVAPGNHDGLFFGSYESQVGGGANGAICRRGSLVPTSGRQWEAACSGVSAGNRPMDRNTFIELYLKAVGIEGSAPWRAKPQDGRFIREAEWHLEKSEPALSYLIQRIALGKSLVGIVLDTVNSDPGAVEDLGGCGLLARVGRKQRERVEHWLELAKQEGSRVVLFGHHQAKTAQVLARERSRKPNRTQDSRVLGSRMLDAWTRINFLPGVADGAFDMGAEAVGHDRDSVHGAAQNWNSRLRTGGLTTGSNLADWLDDLTEKYPVLMYVSAHAHNQGGFYADADGWTELNIGSLVDAPLEYWRLTATEGRDGNRLGGARVSLADVAGRAAGENGLGCARLEPVWRAKPGDLDDYIGYQTSDLRDLKQIKTRLLDTILASMLRYFRSPDPDAPGTAADAGPSSAALDLANVVSHTLSSRGHADKIAAIRRFEDQIQHPRAVQFRQCQAVWAAEAEDRGDPNYEELLRNFVFKRR